MSLLLAYGFGVVPTGEGESNITGGIEEVVFEIDQEEEVEIIIDQVDDITILYGQG